jgi:hypothetical protein
VPALAPAYTRQMTAPPPDTCAQRGWVPATPLTWSALAVSGVAALWCFYCWFVVASLTAANAPYASGGSPPWSPGVGGGACAHSGALWCCCRCAVMADDAHCHHPAPRETCHCI